MILPIALAAVLVPLVRAVPCVQFDTAWNLYAFGGSSDVSLGQNTTWGSPSPQTLPSSGRPPWTGNYTQCLLSQYNDAMYVLGADASNPSNIYVYSFYYSSWSIQTTSSAPNDLGNSRSATVIDHDTNALYTLTTSQGLYTLDLSSITSNASGSALAWSAVENPPFMTTGYTPVLAEASNHINLFGVPSTAAGSADLFVIHFSTFQPDAQSYPTQNNGAAFPDTGGQAISIPLASNNAQDQMAFIPNDFSNTFIVTHWTDPGNYSTTSTVPFAASLINSTQLLPAPGSKDTQAAYAASDTALVQIDSAGNIYYMTDAITNSAVQTSATWTKMSYTLAGTGGTVAGTSSSSSSSSSSSGSSSSTMASSTSSGSSAMTSAASSTTASASSSSSAASSSSGFAQASMGRSDLAGLALGVVALGMSLIM